MIPDSKKVIDKLTMEHVSYIYQDQTSKHEALKDVNFSVSPGEFLVLAGPSGCGKSTLLHLLAGLVLPTQGQIRMDGNIVTGPSLNRAIVFQHYALFPFQTVAKNLLFGIKQAKPELSRKEAREIAQHYLALVDLADKGTYYPYQLSGGMKQRVAIARMLAMDADIFLMDEPFGALDPKLRLELQTLLEKLRLDAASQKTIIFVTHDVDEALTLADRILFLSPQGLTAELQVPFARPRSLPALLQKAAFCRMRKELISLYQQGGDVL